MTPLKNILNSVNAPTTFTDHVTISGSDPVLPSPFLIGEAGAAALSAIGCAAAELWHTKTGESQDIGVSVLDAALAQRSHAHFKLLDTETPALWSPISGFYQTKDNRWVQLHCNFVHHKNGVLNFLGASDGRQSVEEKILNWNALELETQLSELGLCASMLRSAEEWQATEQYQAVSQLPLLEIIKIGESSPEAIPEGKMPLSGIRALDLTRVLAGPMCGKVLAECGATVMRIASPNLPFIPPLVADTGHGKLSAHIDLKGAEGRERLTALIKEADVFSQAYRPGGLDEMGFSPEDLAELRPGIIYTSLSAYSHEGPWAGKHGYDSLVQTATGIAHEQTGDAPKPSHLPAQSLDYLTGYIAAFGVMEALRRRASDGGSYLVRVSLAQTGHWFQNLGRVQTPYQGIAIPSESEIKHLLSQADSGFGKMQFMKPVLQMSATQPFDAFASNPLGSDEPLWPSDC